MKASPDILTLDEFAKVLRVPPTWVRKRLATLPGVIRESRKVVRIHLPTYIARRTK